MAGLDEKRLTHLFTTPVLLHHWPTDLNAALKDVILGRQRSDGGTSYSNVGGWHSSADFEAWSGKPGARLVEMVGAQINQATAEHYRTFQGKGGLVWRITLWANVNRAGDYNRSHIHPGATWSGVYYVDEGDPPPEDRPEAGMLVLHHPNVAAAFGFFPELTPTTHAIRPRAGLMVVFPATLSHEVRPYLGERPRISVAFNAKIETDPDAIAKVTRQSPG
jgi:uncharacterized protein (TIGR02466 family)